MQIVSLLVDSDCFLMKYYVYLLCHSTVIISGIPVIALLYY